MNALLIQRRTVSLPKKETELGLLASMLPHLRIHLLVANRQLPLVVSEQGLEQYVNMLGTVAKQAKHLHPSLAL